MPHLLDLKQLKKKSKKEKGAHIYGQRMRRLKVCACVCVCTNTRAQLLVLPNSSKVIVESVVVIFQLNMLLLQKKKREKKAVAHKLVSWKVASRRPSRPRAEDLAPSVILSEKINHLIAIKTHCGVQPCFFLSLFLSLSLQSASGVKRGHSLLSCAILMIRRLSHQP